MIYLQLFWGFLKVGCFSFGGAYSAIPIIRDVITQYGWMDEEMFSYILAVSESTPGPIMLNLATYIGSEKGGILGSALATLAVVLPAFVIILLFMLIFKNLVKKPLTKAILAGLTPCVIGIILAVGVHLMMKNTFAFQSNEQTEWKAIVITGVLALLYYLSRHIKLFGKIRKMSPIFLIVLSAVFGIIFYAF